MELKYLRRKTRKIAGASFILKEPALGISHKMQKVKGSATKIENIFEETLKREGIKYTKPDLLIDKIVGKPDFVIPHYKMAIFCDGDFWHGKDYKLGVIKNNSAFWDAKIIRNKSRDLEVNKNLKKDNWKVFRFCESQIKRELEKCMKKIKTEVEKVEIMKTTNFTFVDLFAGIGGFRIPLEKLGGKCLGFSEIDSHAIDVYKRNFFSQSKDEIELGDITKLDKLPFKTIDLIVGGVPCQAWSVAGKKNGFDDPRGRLWLDTIRVIQSNQPKAFILENVKGLADPRNKKNLELIIERLTEAGYSLKSPQILNSYDFGLPQNRDRIFLVGVRNDLKKYLSKFEYPKPINRKTYLFDLIEGLKSNSTIKKKKFDPKDIFGEKIPFSRNRFQRNHHLNDFFIFCDTRNGHTTIHSWDLIQTSKREKDICLTILRNRRKKIYGDSDGNPLSFEILSSLIIDLKEKELKTLVKKRILREVENRGYEFVNSKNSSGINGIYRVYLPHSNIFSTLTATGTRDMVALDTISENNPEEYKQKFIAEIIQKKKYRPISPKEAGRLQGFPGWFSIHPKEKIAMKQFGNAVSTNVIFFLAENLAKTEIFKHGNRYRSN